MILMNLSVNTLFSRLITIGLCLIMGSFASAQVAAVSTTDFSEIQIYNEDLTKAKKTMGDL